jgi:hypothetical protein
MFFKPLAYPSKGLWSPVLHSVREIRRQKQRLFQQRHFLHAKRGGPFSLRRGLEFDQKFFKLSITFSCSFLRFRLRNDEGDPVGSPSMS